MNEKKQNLITIPEILRLVIPEDANEYESCWRKTKNCTSPTLENFLIFLPMYYTYQNLLFLLVLISFLMLFSTLSSSHIIIKGVRHCLTYAQSNSSYN